MKKTPKQRAITPSQPQQPAAPASFIIPAGNSSAHTGGSHAANVVRQKLDAIFAIEPDAINEAEEVAELTKPPSKHQQYMQQLSTSGKSLADIQTAWHEYYIGLPDDEKHQVWQEFYAAHDSITHGAESAPSTAQTETAAQPTSSAVSPVHEVMTGDFDPLPSLAHHRTVAIARHPGKRSRTVHEVRQELTGNAEGKTRTKLKARHHLQALAFGVGMGALVVLVLLFGFFNERFIAPFITPSRNVSSTPIIVDPNAVNVGADPKIIIPKINVEIPVVYDVPTIEEKAVEKGLERGVVHYASTANPGEKGNTVIFGHSSNNILNPGKYKFAFVLLSRLEEGDTFYIQKDGKRYGYKIFLKKVVAPTEVEVLDPINGKTATATLITCDPPGTALKRLVVVGEQISPDPAANFASSAKPQGNLPKSLAGNAPSLWSRLVSIF